TEKPGFGFAAGGSSDTRFTSYFGDQWKLRTNLTATFGLRYVRDTGRTYNELATIPCSASILNCTGKRLAQFGPGLGARVGRPTNRQRCRRCKSHRGGTTAGNGGRRRPEQLRIYRQHLSGFVQQYRNRTSGAKLPHAVFHAIQHWRTARTPPGHGVDRGLHSQCWPAQPAWLRYEPRGRCAVPQRECCTKCYFRNQ